jgi:hypothetical protein
MFKCNEIFTVAYWEHMLAAVIFVEFTIHYCYMFIILPNYLIKLIKA